MKISEAEFIQLLTEVLAEREEIEYATILSNELAEAISFSPKFERRMKKLFRNPKAYIKNYHRPMYMKALRMAASILLVISLLFGALMAIPPARAAVLRIIQTWFETFNRYEFTEPGTVVGDWTVGYMSEGYNLSDIFEDGTDTFCVYASDTGTLFFIEILGSDMDINIDNENNTFDTIDVNGMKADFYYSLDDTFPDSLVLHNEKDNIVIKLTGFVGLNELITIAENIRKI